MIASMVIQVEGKSRLLAEKLLGEAFNAWVAENPNCGIVHFFEPVRKDDMYGDYTSNRYHTSMTFFYKKKEVPYGLKELRTDSKVD